MITIYGASDDLIEINGPDGREEHTCPASDRWECVLVAPEGKTAMRVAAEYTTRSVWSITVGQENKDTPLPDWPVTFHSGRGYAAGDPVPGYSTAITVDAPPGTKIILPEDENIAEEERR